MAQRGTDIDWHPKGAFRDGIGRSGCQSDRLDDAMAALANGFYRAMVPIMRLALALSFRRVRVLHDERVPRRGAVLLAANHPSTWTDVLLLDVAFGRRFHFLAQEEQFHPWPRKILLRLYGTLPLSSREHRADATARNAGTFRRCEALFDRGEAVAVFPEGISRAARGLLPLRHGAARLVLSYAARHGGRRPLALVPVGIHYSDRTAFRSEVTVDVGEAIPSAEWRARGGGNPEEAACRLTERMAAEMRGLVLEAGDRRHALVFSVLERLAAGGAGSLELESARRLSQALMDSRRDRPEEFARLERRARAFERMRSALVVSDSALGERALPGRAGAALALLAGSAPALAGLAIHALPAALTHVATRRYASEPSRVAFARIASGFLFFTLAYGAGIALLLAGARIRPVWLLAIVPLSALLGGIALAYTRRMRLEHERCRVAWISRRHGRMVRRARRERNLLRAQALRLLS